MVQRPETRKGATTKNAVTINSQNDQTATRRILEVTFDNKNIRGFDSDGIQVSVWGEIGRGPGQFQRHAVIAANQNNGNVYVGDPNNSRIQVFSSSGDYITQRQITTISGIVWK